jgi:hypothetical protein
MLSHATSAMCASVLLVAGTINATKRDFKRGNKFFADLEARPYGGGALIQATNVPFTSKKMPKNQKKQFQVKGPRRAELGIAASFSIIDEDYDRLCLKRTVTLLRPKSNYDMKLTLREPT